MADIAVANSTYSTGTNDTASTLVNNVTATDAQQWNGVATAAVGIETILGVGTDLKGNEADLATKLAVSQNADGEILINTNGVFNGLTNKYGLIAVSADKKLVPKNIMPIGAMMVWTTDTAPAHWLLCYGQAVDRTTYADLFAIISTTYGVGDGATTFNVPDLRGRVVIATDDMGGSAASRITASSTNGGNAVTLGGVGGAQTHTLVSGEMPAHTHTIESIAGGGAVLGSTAGADAGGGTTGSTGSGGAHSNTQPWIALSYIIYCGV